MYYNKQLVYNFIQNIKYNSNHYNYNIIIITNTALTRR